MKPFSFDVLILGGGAAGLMAAIEAGRRGRRVAVIERAERPGKKILISGGGRCNFTNLHTQPGNFLSANPHFAKSALARYTPADFIRLVERYGIAYHEKNFGPAFLRWLGAAKSSTCLCANVPTPACAYVSPRRSARCAATILLDYFPSSPARTYSQRRHSLSPLVAFPSRRWARRASATTSRASFRFPSSLAVRRWFRLRCPARNLRNSRASPAFPHW
ncbi:MAG: FAD-dependent oxidoreductase [Terracidiphilus sp.]